MNAGTASRLRMLLKSKQSSATSNSTAKRLARLVALSQSTTEGLGTLFHSVPSRSSLVIANRVGASGFTFAPPSEPCVKVSLHTAQAFLRPASAEAIRQSGLLRECLELLRCRTWRWSRGFSNGICSPSKTASLLKILRVFRVIGIGFSPHLDVSLDNGMCQSM